MVSVDAISRRSGSVYTQAAVIVVLATIATTAFLYATVIILPTAQKLSSGETAKCRIVSAELACWRRSLISFSQIEQGHHSCWVFKVERNHTASLGTSSNLNEASSISSEELFTVQYAPVHAFSKARDECDSFETCGNTTWTCTVVTSGESGASPSMIRMRWRYPVKQLVANLTVSLSCYAIAALMIYQYLRQRATGALDKVCLDVTSQNSEECVIDIETENSHDDEMTVCDGISENSHKV